VIPEKSEKRVKQCWEYDPKQWSAGINKPNDGGTDCGSDQRAGYMQNERHHYRSRELTAVGDALRQLTKDQI
jgi:hypothetical protein